MEPLHIPQGLTAVGREPLPSLSSPAGYAALIAAFGLEVPLPDELFAIGERHSYRQEGRWRVLTPRSRPADTVAAHLEFALRHEAVDLGVLSSLFGVLPGRVVADWVRAEPTGIFARRAWFLYEWLTGERLDLPVAPRTGYAPILNPDRQYSTAGETVTRQRVRNNLPGTPDFCPLVRRSEALERLLAGDLAEEARAIVRRVAPGLMARAAAFLLLADSKASYVIEGERPPQDRIQRWGQAIGEAGLRPLSSEDLLYLQRLVIGDARFTHMGWRTEGGFVGPRDRDTGSPLPDHVGARPEDLPVLLRGLLSFAEMAEREDGIDPVAAAAALAFGFVFIHPFEDGNGRVHRWLLHHVLARRGFNPPGVVFPVSAVFLSRIDRYREVLEHFSRPRLHLTRWETTPKLNVRVLHDTRDLFRFFDGTRQAEFLAESVVETMRVSLPAEIEHLRRHDEARRRVEAFLDMPDATFDLMIEFLRQNAGRFSKRARSREFAKLTEEEVAEIEAIYEDLFAPGTS